jgi:hypothetical protein
MLLAWYFAVTAPLTRPELFIGDPDDHEGTARRFYSFQIATVHGCQISIIVVHTSPPRLSNVAHTGSYEPGANFKHASASPIANHPITSSLTASMMPGSYPLLIRPEPERQRHCQARIQPRQMTNVFQNGWRHQRQRNGLSGWHEVHGSGRRLGPFLSYQFFISCVPEWFYITLSIQTADLANVN